MLAGYTVLDLVDDRDFHFAKPTISAVELGYRLPSNAYIDGMIRVISKGMRRTINHDDTLDRLAGRRKRK